MMVVRIEFFSSPITLRLDVKPSSKIAQSGTANSVEACAMRREVVVVAPLPKKMVIRATKQPTTSAIAAHPLALLLFTRESCPSPSAIRLPPTIALTIKDENEAAAKPQQKTTFDAPPRIPLSC